MHQWLGLWQQCIIIRYSPVSVYCVFCAWPGMRSILYRVFCILVMHSRRGGRSVKVWGDGALVLLLLSASVIRTLATVHKLIIGYSPVCVCSVFYAWPIRDILYRVFCILVINGMSVKIWADGALVILLLSASVVRTLATVHNYPLQPCLCILCVLCLAH